MFNFFWIIFSIVCVELTLRLNHMDNVRSLRDIGPGQLIPLLIGIISLLRVIYSILRVRLRWVKGEETGESAKIHCCDHFKCHRSGTARTADSSILSSRRATYGAGENSHVLPAAHTGPSQPRRHLHLLHRFILAWLPWLGLFPALRRPFDIIPFYSRDARRTATRDFGTGYEKLRAPQESPEVPLIQLSPQLSMVSASVSRESAVSSRDGEQRIRAD